MPLPYPVVHPNPSLFESIGSMRLSDIGVIVGCTVAHFALVGYGRKRFPHIDYFSSTSSFMKFHGVSAGFIVAVLASDLRLMGLIENSKEVARYGVYPPDENGTYPMRDPISANWKALKRMFGQQ